MLLDKTFSNGNLRENRAYLTDKLTACLWGMPKQELRERNLEAETAVETIEEYCFILDHILN